MVVSFNLFLEDKVHFRNIKNFLLLIKKGLSYHFVRYI